MRSIFLQGESLLADTSGIDAFKHELTSLMEKEGANCLMLMRQDYGGGACLQKY